MNPIEILGKLLGGGAGGDGGLDELTDMLAGGRRSAPPSSRGGESGMSARELEDMLGVGTGSGSNQPSSNPQRRPTPTQPQSPSPSSRPSGGSSSGGHQGFPGDIFGPRQKTQQVNLSVETPRISQDDEAVLLIRAMINAAKVDGEINDEEQQFILERVGDQSQSTIQFLRSEFARPIDVSEFAGSIPIGMEEKTYLLSLMSIKLDTKQEAEYLRSLGKALRIAPARLNQIHQQQGAPVLYS